MKKVSNILLIVSLLTVVVSSDLYSVTINEDTPSNRIFFHEPHSTEKTCVECHESALKDVTAGFPNQDLCLSCHEKQDFHYVVPKKYERRQGNVTFSHLTHADYSCSACHGAGTKKVGGYPLCDRCHTQKEVELSCTQCHNQQRFEPSYHEKTWLVRHDLSSVTNKGDQHARECNACHGKAACSTCHKTQLPRSHTGFFRIRGHGLKAGIDRLTCKTCHKESYCIRCHKETRPISHVGNWSQTHGMSAPGSTGNNLGKCGLCHTFSWCSQCHGQSRKQRR